MEKCNSNQRNQEISIDEAKALYNGKAFNIYNDKALKAYIEGLLNDISTNMNMPKGVLYNENSFNNDVEKFFLGEMNLGDFFAKCTAYGLMNSIHYEATAMALINDYSYSKLQELGIKFLYFLKTDLKS